MKYFAILFVLTIAGCCTSAPTEVTTDVVEIPEVVTPAVAPVDKPERVPRNTPVDIDCNTTAKGLPETDKNLVIVNCPADCTSGSVWGTDVYTTDSRVCRAAIHAGATQTSGGRAGVVFEDGRDSYSGSEANGVTTSDWGSYERSFSFNQRRNAPTETTEEPTEEPVEEDTEEATEAPADSGSGSRGGVTRGGSASGGSNTKQVGRPKH